jgi:erythrocyte band 7 integral membrane protein
MDNGKTASPSNGHAPGFRPQNAGIIKVQPPRREDLQPSYAQTLQGESDDAAQHGWYGSMSMSSQKDYRNQFNRSCTDNNG